MLEDIDCIVLSPGPGRPDIPSVSDHTFPKFEIHLTWTAGHWIRVRPHQIHPATSFGNMPWHAIPSSSLRRKSTPLVA
jgi:hypothetical protein